MSHITVARPVTEPIDLLKQENVGVDLAQRRQNGIVRCASLDVPGDDLEISWLRAIVAGPQSIKSTRLADDAMNFAAGEQRFVEKAEETESGQPDREAQFAHGFVKNRLFEGCGASERRDKL